MQNFLRETQPGVPFQPVNTSFEEVIGDIPFLECDTNALSLAERYQLKANINHPEVRQRVKTFNEFIKGIPQCEPEPDEIIADLAEKISDVTSKIRVPND